MRHTYEPGRSVSEAQAAAGGRPVYKMSSNENPFGPSLKAVAAITAALRHIAEYPPRDDHAARAQLAALHGRGLSADHFCVGNSALDVIACTEEVAVAGHAPSSAIVCPPTFGAYASSAAQRGAELIAVPLHPETFAVDVEGVLAAVRPDTRLLYLGNPNNPTASAFGGQVLDALLDNLPSHVLVVYDEVYHHFATEFGLPDAIGAVLDGRNLVLVHSLSKVYGLAGLRCGYVIGEPALIARVAARKRSFHLSSLTLAGLSGALDDHEHVARTVANNTAQRRWIIEQLTDLGVRVWPSHANFVLVECPDGTVAAEWETRLLAHGVMVRPAFYLPHHIRVSVHTPDGNRAFIAAMAAELASRDGERT